LVPGVLVANELTAQLSDTWLAFAVAVCIVLSETPHLPQLHLYKVDLIRDRECYAVILHLLTYFIKFLKAPVRPT